MNFEQRLISAAAWELSQRLRMPPRQDPRPQASESSPKSGPSAMTPSVDQEVLQNLAREVVTAVLELSGQDLNPNRMAQTVRSAVLAQVDEQIGDNGWLLSRLAAEAPRLINLPRLARLAREGMYLTPLESVRPEPDAILGENPAFKEALHNLEAVAQTDFPVVLWGETGTGKEVLARRLHRMSNRHSGPFVPVNCAALTGSLLESELFGHVKGAFTGASAAKTGYIGAAKGGTLFLDEIGETGREFQVRLLRVLEDQVVVPVGSHSGNPVDFRLICASHVDLEREAMAGRFLDSLLYRVNVVPLKLPPLRERPEDIGLLAEHFLDQACKMTGAERKLNSEAVKCLQNYEWPGNVRELRHLMQRLAALSQSGEIQPSQLPAGLRRSHLNRLQTFMLQKLDHDSDIPQARRKEVALFLAGKCGRQISNADLRNAMGCSDSTAKNILRALCGLELVRAVGRRGGRRYLVREPGGVTE